METVATVATVMEAMAMETAASYGDGGYGYGNSNYSYGGYGGYGNGSYSYGGYGDGR